MLNAFTKIKGHLFQQNLTINFQLFILETIYLTNFKHSVFSTSPFLPAKKQKERLGGGGGGPRRKKTQKS
jgi:hypothetical protein